MINYFVAVPYQYISYNVLPRSLASLFPPKLSKLPFGPIKARAYADHLFSKDFHKPATLTEKS